MFYYERSVDYPEGHRDVIFDARGIRPLPRQPLSKPCPPTCPVTPAPDTQMLNDYLHNFAGLSAPHTSGTTQDTDWRNNDPAVEPFLEIYQGDRQSLKTASIAGSRRSPKSQEPSARVTPSRNTGQRAWSPRRSTVPTEREVRSRAISLASKLRATTSPPTFPSPTST